VLHDDADADNAPCVCAATNDAVSVRAGHADACSDADASSRVCAAAGHDAAVLLRLHHGSLSLISLA
jgi:hypothetical protein